MRPSIRILAFEDHAAAGLPLQRILTCEQDPQLVGVACSETGLWPLLHRTHPDIVVLDLDHPEGHGLAVCLEIEDQPQSPPVAVCTRHRARCHGEA